jgi:hypothetical protein
MKLVREATATILDATSLADIVVRVDQAARGKPALTYSI